MSPDRLRPILVHVINDAAGNGNGMNGYADTQLLIVKQMQAERRSAAATERFVKAQRHNERRTVQPPRQPLRWLEHITASKRSLTPAPRA